VDLPTILQKYFVPKHATPKGVVTGSAEAEATFM
jgi:hypothetical protein